MNITLSANNNSDIYIIPVVPPNLPIKTAMNNEVLSTLNGDILILGNETLKEFSISSFFPVNKSYKFTANGYEANGWKYVNFIGENKKSKTPIRVVITTKDKYTVLNTLMSIESFVYSVDKVRDIQYELSLKEFPTL
jgi:hypothetical protein